MYKKQLVGFLAFSSLSAFAGGGSSVGPSACSLAPVECTTPQGFVPVAHACVLAGNTALVYVDTESSQGGIELREYSHVTKKPPTANRPGAPTIYSGNGFELSIPAETALHTGFLKAPYFDYSDLEMFCTVR